MPKDIDIKIGKLLREERILRGISQNDVGKSIGISFQQMQKYETGKNRVSLGSLMKMLEYMDSDISNFISQLKNNYNPINNIDKRYVKDFLALPIKVRGRMVSWVKAMEEEFQIKN